MNKTEALAFLKENGLEIALRTLERHSTEKRIAFEKVKGKTGKVNDYSPEALLEYIRNEQAMLGVVVASPAPVKASPKRQGATEVPSPASSASGSLANVPFQFPQAIQKVSQAPTLPAKATPTPPSIAEKILWTLDEASLMTGLSKGRIRDAIKASELRGKQIGRSFKVAPKEVEEWALNLL